MYFFFFFFLFFFIIIIVSFAFYVYILAFFFASYFCYCCRPRMNCAAGFIWIIIILWLQPSYQNRILCVEKNGINWSNFTLLQAEKINQLFFGVRLSIFIHFTLLLLVILDWTDIWSAVLVETPRVCLKTLEAISDGIDTAQHIAKNANFAQSNRKRNVVYYYNFQTEWNAWNGINSLKCKTENHRQQSGNEYSQHSVR